MIRRSKPTRALLDACCWIAAAGSEMGGSSLILKLAAAGYLKIVASRHILQEAARNIKRKMGKEALVRHYQNLASVEIEIVTSPSSGEEALWADIVASKDRHVLASATLAQVDVLISLDKRHILTDRVRAAFPIPVQSSADFLKHWAEAQETSS